MKPFRFHLLLIFFISSFLSYSQDTTRIQLERADSWEYDQSIMVDVQRITGNVIMSHDSAYLYCDSAYLNDEKNNVVAYGNVHIKISDTLNLFGDSLKYDGNTKVARIFSNVKLIDNQTVLTTDTLVFDRKTQIAQYDYWGKIVNDKNNLVSKHGYYYTDKKEFFFKEKVILINPDYIINSDTLMYNTVTEVSYFLGPSTIVSKDKIDSIYCEKGWYDTRFDKARFRKNSIIWHEDQYLTGDSLYYERKSGFGQAFNHALLADTTQNILLMGNYGELQRRKGFAFMVDSAVAVMIDKKDSLFMHSDTVKAIFDTSERIKTVHCYYKMKFFRDDLQGMSDSLVYHAADSTVTMYREPVVWSGKNQLTADSITLTIRNGQADSLKMYNTAFIISEDDTNKFNQIKGRNIKAKFRNNELYKINVIGNSETIYYVREEDSTLIGINKALSSDMIIFLEKNQVNSITYLQNPSAVLYPEKDISPYDLKLKNFKWLKTNRPLVKEDIFIWDSSAEIKSTNDKTTKITDSPAEVFPDQ
jgi:lipopolysaccharide export system protein LptA